MKISIAMCTYNGEQYLQQQLASLAWQTYPPMELVVCDDRSTDATLQILEQFAAVSPFPVRLVQNPKNLGSAANFSQAVALCRGDSIALCDQDDIWHQDKLQKQILLFKRKAELGGVFSDGDLVDEKSKSMNLSLWNAMEFTPLMRKQVTTGSPLLALARRNFVTGATLMFKSSLRDLCFPIPDGWIHDAWIAWKICTYSQLGAVADHLISYRIHANNQIGANLQSAATLLRTRDAENIARLNQEELARMISLLGTFRGTLHGEVLSRKIIERRILFLRSRIHTVQRPYFGRLKDLLAQAQNYKLFAKGWRSMIGDLLA
jgi:glycosyltransferase involved in cell wall biosynthesis